MRDFNSARLLRSYLPMGTFGVLTMPEFFAVTCERPWLFNAPFISCIPEGRYDLVKGRHYSGGYDTIEVDGVPNRQHILFHVGNTPEDTQGCILIGRSYGVVGVQWGISGSQYTFDRFISRFLLSEHAYHDKVGTLTIEQRKGARLGNQSDSS